MKANIALTIMLLGLLLGCSSSKNGEQEAILEAFEAYRSALLAMDGQAALAAVDSETVQLYQDTLDDALTASRSDLDRLVFLRKLMVLQIRLDLSKAELEAMTGEQLFAEAVDQGWIDRSSVENIQVDKVEFQSDFKASISTKQAPGVPVFYLVKESGEWKLALWKTFAIISPALEEEIANIGVSEDEFIIMALEASSGTRIDEAIFEGPLED